MMNLNIYRISHKISLDLEKSNYDIIKEELSVLKSKSSLNNRKFLRKISNLKYSQRKYSSIRKNDLPDDEGLFQINNKYISNNRVSSDSVLIAENSKEFFFEKK